MAKINDKMLLRNRRSEGLFLKLLDRYLLMFSRWVYIEMKRKLAKPVFLFRVPVYDDFEMCYFRFEGEFCQLVFQLEEIFDQNIH